MKIRQTDQSAMQSVIREAIPFDEGTFGTIDKDKSYADMEVGPCALTLSFEDDGDDPLVSIGLVVGIADGTLKDIFTVVDLATLEKIEKALQTFRIRVRER